MKKAGCLLCLAGLLLVSGCGTSKAEDGQTAAQDSGTIIVDGEEWDAVLPEDTVETAVESGDAADLSTLSLDGDELDLTQVSSTIAYSEVFTMNLYPDDFIGKKVRVRGNFTTYQTEDADQDYFVCLVMDSTACCVQGLEFVPDDGFADSSDYPEEGSTILVEGTFSTYERDGVTYSTLSDARLI